MEVNPLRTQADRSAATKDALVRAARSQFAQAGFGDVSTEAIVRAANVSRGAMYHQFKDKTALFEAVFEAVERDVTNRLATIVAQSNESDPIALMELGAHAWLDVCAEPEVQRIVLLDAPAVLGWERWRELGMKHGVGLIEELIAHAIAVGRIHEQPVKPLAHVLIGSLDEAAMYVVRAENLALARDQMRAVISRLVWALSA
ncbi:MAG: TetR/AcrR family transcriptional regulator [Actinomycetota bacterium]|nr:TetR/AcrR family transcriptional regulator [Actinomycetota bacterium]